VGVGIGYGLKDGAIDLQRPYCARFYVRDKFAKRKAARQPLAVPNDLRIPGDYLSDVNASLDGLRRSVRTRWIELPTDVHCVGDMTGSGGIVELTGDPDVVTAGTIVRWQSAGEVHWGIVTVAHGFESRPAITVSNDVTISLVSGVEFVGRRILNFNPVSLNVDATLIEVPIERLMDVGLVSDASPTGFAPSPVYSTIRPENFPTGTSLQADRTIPFTVVGPVTQLTIANVGIVKHMVHILGPNQAFVPGTSGSLIRLLDTNSNLVVPAAIQIGATAQLMPMLTGRRWRRHSKGCEQL
jgi:hypothetical protein